VSKIWTRTDQPTSEHRTKDPETLERYLGTESNLKRYEISVLAYSSISAALHDLSMVGSLPSYLSFLIYPDIVLVSVRQTLCCLSSGKQR